MKKLQLLIFGLFFFTTVGTAQDNDPVILTIDGQDIRRSEFIYIYTKNNSNPSYKKKDLDAYMELFINYKLKVREAEALGYDTIPKLKNELKQYRNQLSLPYMTDKEKNEALIREAYDRTVNEISASHILIRVPPGASPADTLGAYNRIMALRDRIIGGEDFAVVAKGRDGSEDPSVAMNGGNLGYFTALQMVYPFEDAAFNTPVGEISMPVRTSFGYHIIKVTDKRKAAGKMKAAHIMIMVPQKATDEEEKAAEQKINEIWQLLEKGQSFSDLAAKYSDDQTSKSKGGLLPEFGAGTKQRMVPEFEAAAYNIANDGEYSLPVRTNYGWHIIKRIELTPIGTYEEMYRELKLKVERDIRAESSKNSFINKLKSQYDFKENKELLKIFYDGVNENIFSARWHGLADTSKNLEVLCSFKDHSYTVGDFERYLVGVQVKMKPMGIREYVDAKYAVFVQSELTNYEDSQLEDKYPEFRSLMQEYRDGILVFEIMQNEIWKKASKDSVGIRNYYEEHKAEFTYPVRYDGELYKCIDKETANRVIAYLESDTMTYAEIQREINKDSQLNLTVKKHIFNSETTDAFKKGKKGKKSRKFKEGINKVFVYGGEYYVFNVKEVQAPRERKFDEAKGLVTAAYQNHLEQEWLKELRAKYSIEIHEEVLYNLK